MKFLESHFDEYIQAVNKQNLHPSLQKKYNEFPKKISDLKNIIFYGPSGTGKYTQMLHSIKKYSPSELKYEKKLTCVYNKNNYYFKISDIHFEIDMALLGCNSKLLWNDIFINITDVLSARINKNGIIVCKNFHKIHSELLECFYSYIQQNDNNINIIYIFLSDSVTFIPENILNTCNIISVPRPSKCAYNKILPKKMPTCINLNKIYNIKNLLTATDSIIYNNDKFIDNLYSIMSNPNDIKFISFRDVIYDIFIHDMEIGYIIWNLLIKFKRDKKLTDDSANELFIETFSFLQYYNNNYRPIYHLENFLYKIINKVNEF